MKRCPECRRDYYDDTLLYCLDDGNELLEGPASGSGSETPTSAGGQFAEEPATAILHETKPPGEAATRAQIHMTDQTPDLPTGAGGIAPKARGLDKRLLAAPFLLAIVVCGGFFGYRYYKPAVTEQINSIAVLPFENRSGNADTDYLSDGLAESLIYRLSQLPGLKVSPTSSVIRYKGSQSDVAQIAKELEVDTILSGRLVQRGDDLTISVELIDARTKKLIWAEQYDRKMSDLLATQREIATTITQKLELKLSGGEKGITKKYTESNEAYQLYLKGRFHFARRTKDDVSKAIDDYRQAIQLDPNFALAYARLAEVYNQMPAYPYLPPQEAFPQAKAAATRALEIDPNLSEAHTALANTLAAYDWNWAEAEREFKRALELDPNSAAAHFRYGQLYLGPNGQLANAIAEMDRGLQLEPLDVNMTATTAWWVSCLGQSDRTLELGKKGYDLDPNHPVGRNVLTQIYLHKGMNAEALAFIDQSRQLGPNRQWELQNLGVAYAKLGRQADAAGVINEFRIIAETQYVMSYYVATIYAALGDRDKAFAELENAYQERDWRLLYLKGDPFMNPLRDDSRYKNILQRMNLPE